jgi:hypothetical protein
MAINLKANGSNSLYEDNELLGIQLLNNRKISVVFKHIF